MTSRRRSLFEDADRILRPTESLCHSSATSENNNDSDVKSNHSVVTDATVKRFVIPKLIVKLDKLNINIVENRASATGNVSKDSRLSDRELVKPSTTISQKKSNQHIKMTSHLRKPVHCDSESDSDSPISTMSEFESDDDELMDVTFLKNKKHSVKDLKQQKFSKKSDDDDDSFVLPKYKYDLGSILSEREAQMKTNLQIQAMERELKEGHIKPAALPSTVLTANNLDVKQLVLPDIQFKETPPGINVLDLDQVFALYRLPSLPKSYPSTDSAPTRNSKVLDTILSQLEPSQLQEFIKLRALQHLPREISTRSWLMTYIFHLLASHPKCEVVDACHRALWSVQLYYSNSGSFDAERSWRPPVEDMVAVFVNYGAKLKKILPKETIFSHMDMPFLKEMCGTAANTSVPENVQSTQLPVYNLSYFLKTLASYIRGGLYSDEELLTILFSVCSVALDMNVIGLLLDIDFKECIDAALQGFSIRYWKCKIKDLGNCLLHLCAHHHNIVHLAKLLAYNDRALQFQKLFCFLALHHLLEVDFPEECSDVTPYDVYHFVRCQFLVAHRDYYFLHSIFMLIDMCIGKEPSNEFRDNLEDFSSLLREMAGKIRDNVRCLDATRVKNLIVRITTKWSFIVQAMPSSQQKLFRYMTAEQPKQPEVDNSCKVEREDSPELSEAEISELASLQDQLEDTSLLVDQVDWDQLGAEVELR